MRIYKRYLYDLKSQNNIATKKQNFIYLLMSQCLPSSQSKLFPAFCYSPNKYIIFFINHSAHIFPSSYVLTNGLTLKNKKTSLAMLEEGLKKTRN